MQKPRTVPQGDVQQMHPAERRRPKTGIPPRRLRPIYERGANPRFNQVLAAPKTRATKSGLSLWILRIGPALQGRNKGHRIGTLLTPPKRHLQRLPNIVIRIKPKTAVSGDRPHPRTSGMAVHLDKPRCCYELASREDGS